MTTDLERYFKQQAELYGSSFPEEFKYLINPPVPQATQVVEKPASVVQVAEETPITAKPKLPEPNVLKESDSLDGYAESVANCAKCALSECRKQVVFGKGNPEADILIVSEAPSEEEDKRGNPFVGEEGALFENILAAINLSLDDVYVTNIVKCKTPVPRDPDKAELDACSEILKTQIAHIQPKIILAFGRVSGRTLTNSTLSLTQMRQQQHQFQGVQLFVTNHTKAMLRDRDKKMETWKDVRVFRKAYDQLIS
jgi:DNA polymerase